MRSSYHFLSLKFGSSSISAGNFPVNVAREHFGTPSRACTSVFTPTSSRNRTKNDYHRANVSGLWLDGVGEEKGDVANASAGEVAKTGGASTTASTGTGH